MPTQQNGDKQKAGAEICNPSVSKTLKHETIHFVASLTIAFLIQFLYSNILLSLFTFSLAMFLDADHLFDYFLYLRKYNQKFSLKEFISGSYFLKWQKFITPLHAWEIVIIVLLVHFLWIPYPIFISIALALTSHYFVDYFTNSVNKMAYFLTFRYKNKFEKKAIAKNRI